MGAEALDDRSPSLADAENWLDRFWRRLENLPQFMTHLGSGRPMNFSLAIRRRSICRQRNRSATQFDGDTLTGQQTTQGEPING
jgi:hypothetical protein